ncbi:MAG: hypothetical protein AAGI53_15640 [Planctomycetota bacterium]
MRYHAHRPAFGGLGLVGLLVVMLIIMMLYFTAGPSGKSYVETVQETRERGVQLKADIEYQQLVTMVVQHKLASNTYPDGPEDLGVANLPGYRDEHGTLIRFETRQEGNQNLMDVISAGEDRQHGTEDDVVMKTLNIPV